MKHTLLCIGLFLLTIFTAHAQNDLRFARIDFISTPITNPETELHGRWDLYGFESSDLEMRSLVHSGTFRVWLLVEEQTMQVNLQVMSNMKNYADPLQTYTIQNGMIHMENPDFAAGYTGEQLVLTMIAGEHAYRYTFARRE